ncbi:unnamed protein product [Polarella glacialis]|uniref:Uncharacterized protein n=1 Tax=Polarella glacialis TaxID=89957 RepID=A0A813LLS9_POLGL|nr:unnamed protein product [Polarella glacialis]
MALRAPHLALIWVASSFAAESTACDFTGFVHLHEHNCQLTDTSTSCCSSWQAWGNASIAIWKCLAQGNASCSSQAAEAAVEAAEEVVKTCGGPGLEQAEVLAHCLPAKNGSSQFQALAANESILDFSKLPDLSVKAATEDSGWVSLRLRCFA